MSEVIAGNYVLFDHVDYNERRSQAPEIARDILTLADAAIRFAAVERVPRYDCTSRENDAEHSFMLSLVATDLAATYFPYLDAGLVSQYSTVHDLPELETMDVATFILDDSEIAVKEAAEQAILPALVDKLPTFTGRLLVRYEQQQEPEARFVRLTDKLLPVAVDILGPGKQVMMEDYAITTQEQLDANETRLSGKFRRNYPSPLLRDMHQARDILAERFSKQFTKDVV